MLLVKSKGSSILFERPDSETWRQCRTEQLCKWCYRALEVHEPILSNIKSMVKCPYHPSLIHPFIRILPFILNLNHRHCFIVSVSVNSSFQRFCIVHANEICASSGFATTTKIYCTNPDTRLYQEVLKYDKSTSVLPREHLYRSLVYNWRAKSIQCQQMQMICSCHGYGHKQGQKT